MSVQTDTLKPLPFREVIRSGERILSWGLVLSVVVRDDGDIGQFACSENWSRAEIEEAVITLWNAKAVRPAR